MQQSVTFQGVAWQKRYACATAQQTKPITFTRVHSGSCTLISGLAGSRTFFDYRIPESPNGSGWKDPQWVNIPKDCLLPVTAINTEPLNVEFGQQMCLYQRPSHHLKFYMLKPTHCDYDVRRKGNFCNCGLRR